MQYGLATKKKPPIRKYFVFFFFLLSFFGTKKHRNKFFFAQTTQALLFLTKAKVHLPSPSPLQQKILHILSIWDLTSFGIVDVPQSGSIFVRNRNRHIAIHIQLDRYEKVNVTFRGCC